MKNIKSKSIRELLSKPVIKNEEVIVHDEIEFKLVGGNDGRTLLNLAMRDVDHYAKMSKHYKAVYGGEFSQNDLCNVELVHKCLQSDDELPLTLDDIIKLLVQEGTLFIKLLEASSKVLGLTQESLILEDSDALGESAVKNS